MAYQFQKISILVVEDSLPMLEITKALLETFGVGMVYSAQNGEMGFNRYCQYNPDIVIADWMMKEMDGISFTRTVRSNHRSPNPYVPIILMTGFSEKRRVIEARDAGVTEFLVKPFNANDLYRRIVQVIERPRQFIRAPEFFGPDRRRARADAALYAGHLKREEDATDPLFASRMLAQKKEAQMRLEQMRKAAGLGKGDRINLNPDDIDLA